MTQNVLQRPWYKERWPWLLMLGPGIVVVAGFITAWLAITTSDGVVEDDYYKQGLAINQRIHRDHAARDLGLAAELMHNENKLRLLLTSTQLKDLPAQLSFRLVHPTRSGFDQNVVLHNEGQGFYSGTLEQSTHTAARWNVFIEDQDLTWRLMGVWSPASEEPLKLLPQH